MPRLPLRLWCNIGGIKAHFQEGKTTFSNSTTDLKGAVGPSAPLQPPNGFLENFQVSLFEPRLLVPECESVLGGHVVASVQFRSVAQSAQLFMTPWTPDFSFSNSPNLLKLMSVESVMPSNHLILCHPLLLLPSIFPSIRVFSKESVLRLRWPKYWSFSFSISPSNEYSGLISFRMD